MLFEKKTLAGYRCCWLAIEGERRLFGQNQFALGSNSQAIFDVVVHNRKFTLPWSKQGVCRQSLSASSGWILIDLIDRFGIHMSRGAFELL